MTLVNTEILMAEDAYNICKNYFDGGYLQNIKSRGYFGGQNYKMSSFLNQ